MIKSKKQMYIVIGAFILTLLLGTTTYAFFNYTRAGTANVIRTGQINFATTQSSGQDGAINLTDAFPIDVTNGVPSNNANVGEVTINVTGDTTYTGGIEYLVTATNVTNAVGNKVIPIGINVTATSGLGTSDDAYFTDKENNPETSIYKVLAGDTLESDTNLLVGYIKSGQTGVDGNITVKAYLDASKVAISDTYYENAPTPTPTAPNDEYGTPASFGEDRVVLTTTEWNSLQSSGVSFKVKVEANEGTWVKQIPTISLSPASGGVASGSSTTSTISTTGDGTMTCSSSNQSIATCSVSGNTLTINGIAAGTATITVNQAEGTNYTSASTTYAVTVAASVIPTIASCPDCVYIYLDSYGDFIGEEGSVATNPLYTSWNTESETPTVINSNQYVTDYRIVDGYYGPFLGLKLNSTTGEIDHAYICDGTSTTGASVPFCVEGTSSNDATAIRNFLNSSEILDGACSEINSGSFQCGDFGYYNDVIAYGDSGFSCSISTSGEISCE